MVVRGIAIERARSEGGALMAAPSTAIPPAPPRIVQVTFRNIPDYGGSAGWICWFGGEHSYTDSDPLGRGSTIREAFDFMLDRIATDVIEKTAFDHGSAPTEKP